MRTPDDIPPYTVRISKKASRVILKIAPHLGLQVVIPLGFDSRRIPQILEKRRQWIRVTYERLCAGTSGERLLPQSICLKATGEHFDIRYTPGADGTLTIQEHEGGLLELSGETQNVRGCSELLKRWLKHMGRARLIPLAVEQAACMGLRFKRVQIRAQKSRWGSFSGNFTLSLNCKLLFLAPELVQYTLIHELCHSVHLNHSEQFWHLVETHCPDFQAKDARLIEALKDIPGWAE